MILENINKVNDIKDVKPEDYEVLAKEIREFMVDKISKTGGHLASSLGVVELTMALHKVLDLPKDKIIWDVGHQCYAHKILTGRKEGFDNIRSYRGMSGFPKRSESDCDAFNTGHSTTSISAGLGLAEARRITNQDYTVVSVIGDGSLTGGMAYEALNNAGKLDKNFIVVLNDNNMAISENVGNVSRMMTSLRTDPKYIDLKESVAGKIERIPKVGSGIMYRLRGAKSSLKQLIIPGMFFEDLGLKYLGPVDGHNISELIKVFEDAKRVEGAVVVHVMTDKGRGYAPAENDPETFHGVGKFDKETGEVYGKKKPDYSAVFGEIICKMAENNQKIACITAAMPEGTGLKKFSKEYTDRFFDVGIAEEHAVTFAAGLAVGGLKPYVCLYSSFLQRGFDQLVHDVCIQNLPVTFIIDRAGIVGADGETHQGLLDISILSCVPNMTVFAPKNAAELIEALKFSETFNGPLAIRFPRGEAYRGLEEYNAPIEYAKSEVLTEGYDVAIIAAGNMVESAMNVYERLKTDGINISVINARFLSPIDKQMIDELSKDHKVIFTIEEGEKSGGFGEKVASYAIESGYGVTVCPIAIPDIFVTHGDVPSLRRLCRIDEDGIYRKIREYI